MDERQRDEILWRLDERTKKVDDHLERLDARVREIEETTEDHDERIRDNEETLADIAKVGGGFVATLTAAVGGIAAKVAGLLHL